MAQVQLSAREGELTKRVLREGTGETPPIGSLVRVHYTVRSAKGELYDTTSGREPFTFVLGHGQTIVAFDKAVARMQRGEVARILAKPSYTFGPAGCPPQIPSGTVLEIEIELVDFEQHSRDTALSIKERLEEARRNKEEGNAYFQRQAYRRATRCYNQALSLLSQPQPEKGVQTVAPTAEERQAADDLKLVLYGNLAACGIKLQEYSKAIANSRKVLELDKANCKAYYRLGMAFQACGEFELAVQNLARASQLDPNDSLIKTKLEQAKEQWKGEKKKDKLFEGMFNK